MGIDIGKDLAIDKDIDMDICIGKDIDIDTDIYYIYIEA